VIAQPVFAELAAVSWRLAFGMIAAAPLIGFVILAHVREPSSEPLPLVRAAKAAS
jgi:hypothetical protein